MSVTLYLRHGDCVAVLADYPEGSVGAVVSDPPYGLKFMGMGWDALDGRGKDSATEIDRNRSFDRIGGNHNPTSTVDAARTRQLENQRQQKWHHAWLAECYRVLPPGGVLKAFSATRTFHRMAAAMQEAGFTDLRVEAWAYGSGFPKSMNIGKSIDKRPAAHGSYGAIKAFLRASISASPKSRAEIDAECGFHACDFGRSVGASPFVNVIPDTAKWAVMKRVIGFGDDWDETLREAERSVVGVGQSGKTAIWHEGGSLGQFDITEAASPQAKAWEGWGTALKPSWEPVLVGKKPHAP